uniref:Putative ovule protein n=1 Tax=Solanum chacoense TaxID=4108 RepID=A0A0V0HB77_SOLCH
MHVLTSPPYVFVASVSSSSSSNPLPRPILHQPLLSHPIHSRSSRGPECYQSYATVVQVLFRHFLRDTEDQSVTSLDHIFTVESMEITSPSTDSEIFLALRVLEGCCLIHCESNVLAHEYKAIPVLMNILSTWY